MDCKNVETRGHNVLRANILGFGWREWGKPQKTLCMMTSIVM